MKINSSKRLLASTLVPDSFKLQNDYFMAMTATSPKARPISVDNSVKYTYKNFAKFCGVYDKNNTPVCAFKYTKVVFNGRVLCLSVIFVTKLEQSLANNILSDLLEKGKLFGDAYSGLATTKTILSTTSNAYRDLLQTRALEKHTAFVSTSFENGPFIELQPQQYTAWKQHFCSVSNAKNKFYLIIPGNGFSSSSLKANLGKCITLEQYTALLLKKSSSSSGSPQSPKLFRPIPNNKLIDDDWKALFDSNNYSMLTSNKAIAYIAETTQSPAAQINAKLKYKLKYKVNELSEKSLIAFVATLNKIGLTVTKDELSDGRILSKAFSAQKSKDKTLIFYYVKRTDKQNNISYMIARLYFE